MERVDEQLVAPGALGADSLDAIARSLARIGTATFFSAFVFRTPPINLLVGLWGRRGLATLLEHELPPSARRGLRQVRAVVDLWLFLSIGPSLVAVVLVGRGDRLPAALAVVTLASLATMHLIYDRSAAAFGELSKVLGAPWLVRHWRSARRWNLVAAGVAVVLVAFVLGSAVHGPALVGFGPATAAPLAGSVQLRSTSTAGALTLGTLGIIELGVLLNVAATFSAMRDHVRDLRRDLG